jgi:glycosyltransferase involved in cell wall biosynthesis
MARGCPVVASDIPAVREISGSGALLVAPDDLSGWADALRRVVEDDGLRTQLSALGVETVARYSWDETARRVAHLLGGLSLDRTT